MIMSSNLLINCQSITKSYSNLSLFSDLSLGFYAEERTGLIGPNGSGKSTLLKILAGLETPDSGEVTGRRGIRLVYLPQNEDLHKNQTVEHCLLEVMPQNQLTGETSFKVMKAASRMGFSSLDNNVSTLSGGWIKRLAMTRALIQEPDLLLLDEPTNHLDLEGILLLEKVLANPGFAFIMVSHDRAFLENVTNRTVELNKLYPRGCLQVQGNYSSFLEKRQEFINSQDKLEQTLANRTRREIEWLRRGPKARTTKAKHRINAAYMLQNELGEVRSRNTQNKTAGIEFTGTGRKTRKLLQAEGITFRRQGSLLFENLSFTLSPGNCLGIMGRNGAGKSSLLHLLAGDVQPEQGSIKRADGLKVILFDQGREQLDQDQTLKEALCPSGDQVVFQGRPLHVVSWARRMLFQPEQLPLPVSRLSGGEQSRLLIARLMLVSADILLLDEPTNDIDIPTLEILEQSLGLFPGAIVLISHDRMFLDILCDKLLFLDGQGKGTFFADYAQYIRSFSREDKPESSHRKTSQPKSEKPKKMSYKDQREFEGIEEYIEMAETEVIRLRQEMETPEAVSDSGRLVRLCSELKQAEARVSQLYARWEELEDLAELYR